jgi:antitoxin component YwqK of YwqJK toxin-antitoxin module
MPYTSRRASCDTTDKNFRAGCMRCTLMATQHFWFLKKFSGWVYALHPDGDTALLVPYSSGKEEGWSRRRYKGKKQMEERFYRAGRKEGVHKGWWPDGKEKFVYVFNDDEHEGPAEEWFENGKPSRLFHYAKGQEEGLQKLWWEDGSIRANYVVKEGQQYGLIGRKVCVNNDSTKIN